MRKKFVAHLLWLVLVSALTFFAARATLSPWLYDGSNVEINVASRDILVVNSTATFEAASWTYFLFDNRNGATIHAAKVDKPLGWIYEEYWKAGPVSISSGEWVVQEGTDITVHISEGSEVQVKSGISSLTTFFVGLVFLIIWFLGSMTIKSV